MFLFGGSYASGEQNQKFYSLAIDKLSWAVIKNKGMYQPESRDEHTACVYGNDMFVFGGFENGIRKNTIIRFEFNTSSWF